MKKLLLGYIPLSRWIHVYFCQIFTNFPPPGHISLCILPSNVCECVIYSQAFSFALMDSYACVCAKSPLSCLTVCDSMDHSQPGSSVHGILQARTLEWVATSFSRVSSWPRDWTCIGYGNLDSVLKKHYFANEGPYSQSYSFSSSHVWIWELDHKEGWALKSWCSQSVVLEKTLQSPLG